jgi:TonB family protein
MAWAQKLGLAVCWAVVACSGGTRAAGQPGARTTPAPTAKEAHATGSVEKRSEGNPGDRADVNEQAQANQSERARGDDPAAAADKPGEPPPPDVVENGVCDGLAADKTAIARRTGTEGVVIVRYRVSESGEIKDAHVVKGPDGLRAAALDMMESMKCTPTTVNGAAIAVTRFVKIPFYVK